MRRVVIALVLIMVAVSLVACSSGGATSTTDTQVPATGATPPAATPAAAPAQGDNLSPLPSSASAAFPTDPASVPQAVLDDLVAHKPMLVFWFDPTTNVSTDQRAEIDVVLKKYVGAIELVSFDYTSGIPVGGSTLPAEIDKSERMTGLLNVNTTPYIVLVDSNGQITHRFAGFVDRGLLEREVLRATQ